MGINQPAGWDNILKDRLEGKQDSWLGNEQGKLQLSGSHHLVQESCLEGNGEDGLEGKWYETSCAPRSRVGLWIVESLATSGLYIAWYLKWLEMVSQLV